MSVVTSPARKPRKHPYQVQVGRVDTNPAHAPGAELVYEGHLDGEGAAHPPIELEEGHQYVFRTRFNDFAARNDPDLGWAPWTGFNAAGVPFIMKPPPVLRDREAEAAAPLPDFAGLRRRLGL